MRAFVIEDFGAVPILRDIAVPEPGTGEVRVNIAACALNFADLLMIEGRYQERPTPPVTLGMELAGTVDRSGADVQGLVPGDRVAVYAGHGGLAEAGVFAAARCTRIPDGMAFDTAAALQIATAPAIWALVRRATATAGRDVAGA